MWQKRGAIPRRLNAALCDLRETISVTAKFNYKTVGTERQLRHQRSVQSAARPMICVVPFVPVPASGAAR